MVKTLTIERDNLQVQVNALKKELEALAKPVEPIVTAPDIFANNNSAVVPYFGSWNVYYWKNGLQVKRVLMTPKKFYSIWDDEFYLDVKDQVIGMDPINDWYNVGIKLYNWMFTLGIVYQNDLGPDGKAGENWRLVPEIYYGKIDDCDRTPLFIVACRIAGIPADKVFHITGTYNKLGTEIGHSFAGIYNKQNEFIILEMTQKRTPIKMIGSEYRCNGILSGCTNWQFQGQPKNEQW
jgi:hypothetical protein